MTYEYDDVAQVLAEAVDETWGTMTTADRDWWRRVAEAAAERYAASGGCDCGCGCDCL